MRAMLASIFLLQVPGMQHDQSKGAANPRPRRASHPKKMSTRPMGWMCSLAMALKAPGPLSGRVPGDRRCRATPNGSKFNYKCGTMVDCVTTRATRSSA